MAIINSIKGGVMLATLLALALVHQPVAAQDHKPVNHKVEIVKFKFVPAVLDVRKGDTVTWTNHDIVPHTATSEDGSLDTGEILAGQSRTLLIESDSAIDYICTYHPLMKGQLD